MKLQKTIYSKKIKGVRRVKEQYNELAFLDEPVGEAKEEEATGPEKRTGPRVRRSRREKPSAVKR